MKYLILALVISVGLSSCKKEDALPRLSFSQQERAWFIYQVGQKFEFKTASAEAITFVVDSLRKHLNNSSSSLKEHSTI